MSAATTLVCYATAAALTIKIWYDLVDYLHYRERMNVYKTLAVEGCKVIKQALDQDRVSELVDAWLTPASPQGARRQRSVSRVRARARD